MKFEFFIPASPVPAFFSQIAMFRRALDRLGGDYAGARVVAVFGDAEISEMPPDWARHLNRVETHWVSREDFAARGYFAQSSRRFDLITPDADLSVLCDADVLMLRPFDQNVLDLIGKDEVAGVIAHYHFGWSHTSGNPAQDWKTVAHEVLGSGIALDYAYTLAGIGKAEAPFYVNFGVVAGTPAGLKRVRAEMQRIEKQTEEMIDNYFSAQVAFALAVAQSKVTARALPMRYNFPNDERAEALFPAEAEAIIFLHYLRLDRFDRQKIFATPEAFQSFMELKLSGTNELLQDNIRMLTGGAYPFPPFAQALPTPRPSLLRRFADRWR